MTGRLLTAGFSFSLLLGFSGSYADIAFAVEQTPKQFYMQYHQKCLVVSSPKALLPWRSKTSIARDQPMSDDEIDQVYPMIKDMMSKHVTVISEAIDGDRATLKVTGEIPDAVRENSEKPGVNGQNVNASTAAKTEQAVEVVLLIKEGGQWKMDHESWTSR